MLKSLLLAVTIVAHEPGYYTSLSKHLQRWLRGNDISSSVVTPAQMTTSLAKEKLAFLVGFDSPSPSEMKTLRDFRARGGKLVVFYSSSPALAKLMDVRPLGFEKAAYPGQWSAMKFNSRLPEGVPHSILQTSTVLQKAEPLPGKGKILASWVDRYGKPTGDAAWISTAGGYWMTHVLLADGDEHLKSRLLAAIAGGVQPSLWNAAKADAKESAEIRAQRDFAKRQVPRKGEIHAVWDHSGCGLYPRNWPRTMKILQESRVTDLFVNVAGAGFAHYPSAVLARSKIYEDEGDQLAACLAAARGTGIRVHAWVLCFTSARAAPSAKALFAKRGWYLKTPKGAVTEFIDPSNADVRAHVLRAIDEMLAKYPSLAGIHLDFVRWGDSAAKPKSAPRHISEFVAEARRRVKRPRWLTTAVYGKYPNCIASVGQDWDAWLSSNLVDYVVPMDYTENMDFFKELLDQHGGRRSHARRTIVGIGVTANESRLDARQVINQINLSRRYGFAGNALFDLDTTLEKRILPYLRLGIW